MNPDEIDEKMMEVVKKHLELVNNFLTDHIKITRPDNIEPEHFLDLALSAPAMIAADIIQRVAGTFGKTDKEIYNFYRLKVKQGLGLIENRSKNTKAVSKKSGK